MRVHGLCALEQKNNTGTAFGGKFHYFSTHEIFGPASDGVFHKEWDRYNPNQPYAGSKSAAEMACISFARTYQMPIFITNVVNVFGERQHPETFLPLVIRKILADEEISIHSNKERTQAGKRQYLHARNVAAATVWLLQNGKLLDGSNLSGRYNLVSEMEIDNLSLAQLVAKTINEYREEKGKKQKPLRYSLVDFHASRPGHDLRFALNGDLLKKEGFSYPASFEKSLRETVRWSMDHPQWL